MSSRDGRGGLWRSRWAAIGAAVAITFGAGGLVAVNAAGGVESSTVMIDPARVLDSRDPVNVGLPGPFASQVSQKLRVTGSVATTTGVKTVVPTGATGVLLNVTTVNSTANGFISIRPGDASGAPSTSSLNFEVGDVVPNAVTVALPTDGSYAGQIDITYDAYGATGPTTDILIDVVGYMVPGGGGATGPVALWAVVNSDGSLVRGSQGATAAQLFKPTVNGAYEVDFGTDVTDCVLIATLGRTDAENANPAPGEIGTAYRNGKANAVFVKTYNSSGIAADGSFHLSVLC